MGSNILCVFLFSELKQELRSKTKRFFKNLITLPTFAISPIIENQTLSVQNECYDKSRYHPRPMLFGIIGNNSTAKLKDTVHADFAVTSVG